MSESTSSPDITISGSREPVGTSVKRAGSPPSTSRPLRERRLPASFWQEPGVASPSPPKSSRLQPPACSCRCCLQPSADATAVSASSALMLHPTQQFQLLQNYYLAAVAGYTAAAAAAAAAAECRLEPTTPPAPVYRHPPPKYEDCLAARVDTCDCRCRPMNDHVEDRTGLRVSERRQLRFSVGQARLNNSCWGRGYSDCAVPGCFYCYRQMSSPDRRFVDDVGAAKQFPVCELSPNGGKIPPPSCSHFGILAGNQSGRFRPY